MASQEKTKIVIFSNPRRIFILEAVLFSLALVLGISTAFKMNKSLEIDQIIPNYLFLWEFVIYFLLATLFIFLISKFLKFKKTKNLIFKAIFVLTTLSGGITFFSVWLPNSFSLILITILILWWLKKPLILIQDALIIITIAGAGSFLGLSLHPSTVIFLLIIFSIYDFIAVFKTKHMVKMAKEMIKSKAILALIIPPEISSFKEELGRVEPGGKFLILGGGDIIFPLLLTSALIPFSIIDSLIVAVFSLIGLLFSFLLFISQKIRQPIPALPPIALFSIIGFLITLLL